MMPPRQTITKDELRRSNRTVILHLIAVIAWFPVFYFFIRPFVPEWLGIIIFGIVFWWCLWVIGTSCVGIFRRPRVIDSAGSNQAMQPTASPRTASLSDD
jgi:hypothetical protein